MCPREMLQQAGSSLSSQTLASEMHGLQLFLPTQMKYVYLVLALPLFTACVSIDLPGVVSDTAKVAKDTYKSVSGKKEEGGEATAATESANSVSNTYIGQDNQTVAEVKQLCVSEAAAKLFKASGKEVPYTVMESTISTVNNAIASNCKVAAAKVAQAPSTEKQ